MTVHIIQSQVTIIKLILKKITLYRVSLPSFSNYKKTKMLTSLKIQRSIQHVGHFIEEKIK